MPATAHGLAVLRGAHRLLASRAVRSRLELRLLSRAGKDFVLPDYPIYASDRITVGRDVG